MRKFGWSAKRIATRLGWPAVMGFALLLLGAAMHWEIGPAERARIDDRRAASLALAETLQSRENQPKVPDQAEIAARFSRALPLSTTEQRTAVLASIQSAAVAEGLVLEQANYAVDSAAAESFDGLEIVLPVKGTYLQIRRFMSRTLADNSALALEAVSLNRQSVNEPAVEAQLRFTLFLQKP